MSVVAEKDERAATIVCNCSPTKVKITTLARNTMLSQNPVPHNRVAAVMTEGEQRFAYTPAATTARTPDKSYRYAGTYATNGNTREINPASWGSSTRRHAWTASHPPSPHITTAPAPPSRKRSSAPDHENPALATALIGPA